MSRMRVVIAEDHYLVREGVRQSLAAEDIEVVASVATADELLEVVSREQVDAVVTDIRMPPSHRTEGLEAARRIRTDHPDIGVVVLSQYAIAAYAMALLEDGTEGRAYLLKDRVADPMQLVAAIGTVVDGGSVIDPAVVAAMVARSRQRRSSPLRHLTPRELEVLQQMAEGRTNAGVAASLHLTESTIEKHATSLFRKLGLTDEPHVHRRVAAVVAFLREQASAEPLVTDDD